ncbi:hypothetical protein TNCV_556301 [Trichonephila clavipes]|uniref:Uncharacterized protein n=1 Tax=Trichonephila clavipes TaxID=2585209 RepID=A0A8X6RVC1_TRICX|nr:hypothetical protein TNCV_556301 [Trichonephila clavipes]
MLWVLTGLCEHKPASAKSSEMMEGITKDSEEAVGYAKLDARRKGQPLHDGCERLPEIFSSMHRSKVTSKLRSHCPPYVVVNVKPSSNPMLILMICGEHDAPSW